MRKYKSSIILISGIMLFVIFCSILMQSSITGVIGKYFQTFNFSITLAPKTYTIYYIHDAQEIYKVTDLPIGTAQDLTDYNKAATTAFTTEINKENDIYGGAYDGYVVDYWMNAGSTKVTEISADNTEDVYLYPSFVGRYTATFVSQKGEVLGWTIFTANATGKNTVIAKAKSITAPTIENCEFDYWIVQDASDGSFTALSDFSFDGVTTDITIYPVYVYQGDVNLIPIDNDGDGQTDEYQVGGYSDHAGQALVEIPDYVNGIPVTSINENAFSSYEGVHSVVIPNTITTAGVNILAEDWGWFDSGETVTIYYEGTRGDWIKLEETFDDGWDDGLSESSRIFFLGEDGKVDPGQDYLQASKSDNSINWSQAEITTDIANEYTGYCNCTNYTEGDTAHIYVDEAGNIMGRNDEGTPINSEGVVIERKQQYFWTDYMLTTDFSDTYYRYRPDRDYWLGVTIN